MVAKNKAAMNFKLSISCLLNRPLNQLSHAALLVVVVVVVRVAPDIPEMSVPGVGYSFKPKGLAFVTPLYPV